ncbi:MAG: hypothetical protein J6A47_05850 [Bacilli bacterium]|nr:hypothetical protein [Bacilli bacterium]
MKDNRVILLDCFGLFAPDPFGGYLSVTSVRTGGKLRATTAKAPISAASP